MLAGGVAQFGQRRRQSRTRARCGGPREVRRVGQRPDRPGRGRARAAPPRRARTRGRASARRSSVGQSSSSSASWRCRSAASSSCARVASKRGPGDVAGAHRRDEVGQVAQQPAEHVVHGDHRADVRARYGGDGGGHGSTVAGPACERLAARYGAPGERGADSLRPHRPLAPRPDEISSLTDARHHPPARHPRRRGRRRARRSRRPTPALRARAAARRARRGRLGRPDRRGPVARRTPAAGDGRPAGVRVEPAPRARAGPRAAHPVRPPRQRRPGLRRAVRRRGRRRVALRAVAARSPLDADGPHAEADAVERALALWRGAALAEFAVEPWAAPEAARLEELRLVARERLVDAQIRAGRAPEAVVAAEALVRDVPLREEGWRLLALGQYLGGRQGDALATLRRARRTLSDELGVDPGPATRCARARRARADRRTDRRPAARAPRAAPAAPPVPDLAPPPAGSSGASANSPHCAPPRTMRVRAQPAIALVAGEAGGGKSALLGRFRDELLAGGWRISVGRCPEDEGGPPARAWSEALRDLARERDPGPFAETLEPLLGDRLLRPSDDSAGLVQRFRLHRAVHDWLATLDDRPLVVFLDDVHRADGESRTLLSSLLDQGLPNRVLFVLAFRPETGTGTGLDELLATLARYSPTRLRLQRSRRRRGRCTGRVGDRCAARPGRRVRARRAHRRQPVLPEGERAAAALRGRAGRDVAGARGRRGRPAPTARAAAGGIGVGAAPGRGDRAQRWTCRCSSVPPRWARRTCSTRSRPAS